MITKPGNFNGLNINLFLEPLKESIFTDARGLRIMIHNESYIPTSNDGFPVNAGVKNSIQITRTDYYRLGPPYNDCVKPGDTHDSELYNYMINSNMSYTLG